MKDEYSFKKSETLLHITKLLTAENLEKFNNSNIGDSILFPFDLQTFCIENDKKINEFRTFISNYYVTLLSLAENYDDIACINRIKKL